MSATTNVMDEMFAEAAPTPQPDANGEFASPLDGALFMASFGIPQTPLHGKDAFLPGFQNSATTDVQQIRKWAEEHPGCNFGSVAKKGGFLVFEMDSPPADTPNAIERFTKAGGTITAKLMIRSRVGRGHCWYKSADGVENIQQGFTKHGDFSVRANNMYCVSGGSIHPETKKQYAVLVANGFIFAGAPEEPSAKEISFWKSEKISKDSKEPERNSAGLIPKGSVHTFMHLIGSRLRGIGLNYETLQPALRYIVEENCEPPINTEKVDTMARWVSENYPAGDLTKGAFLPTGLENDSTPTANMPDALHEDAYYGIAGRHLRNVEQNSEAHPAGVLALFLSGFGSMVGRNAFIRVEDNIHYPAVNVIVTGKSSRGRKDTAASRGLRPLKEADPIWNQNNVRYSFSSGEALVSYFDALRTKLGPGAFTRLFVLDTEFKTTLTICGRQGNTLSENYRRLFNGDPMEVNVKNSKDRIHAPVTCGSVAGLITLGELLDTLKEVEMVSGFTNRFLPILVHRVKKISRPVRYSDSAAVAARQAIVEEIKDALTWIEKHKDDGYLEDGEDATGLRMEWDETAGEAWDNFYNALADDDPVYLNRAEVFVLRLTMIYALLDKTKVMRLEHLKAALAVWEYAKQSARLIYDSQQSPDVGRLLAKALATGKMKRGAVHSFFGRNKAGEVLDWLMEEAVNASKGKLEIVPGLDRFGKPTIAGIKRTDTASG